MSNTKKTNTKFLMDDELCDDDDYYPLDG